jgi:hypothetical protein
MQKIRNAQNTSSDINPEGKRYFEYIAVSERIILN